MDLSSRKETFQRKRSRTQRRQKRRWITAAAAVVVLSLALVVWLSYEQGRFGGGAASPPAIEGQGGADAGGQGSEQPQGSSGGAPDDKTSGSQGQQPPGSTISDGASGSQTPGSEGGTAGGTDGTPGAGGSGAQPPASSDGEPGSSGGDGASGAQGPDGTASPPEGTSTPGQSTGAGEGNDEDRVHLTFTGDVMFSGNAGVALNAHGMDYPYREVRSYLERADLTIANLETPITERGTAAVKQYAYRSSPKALPAFKEAGFDLVSLSNNHILDYGTEGLLDTLRHLDNAEIGRFGAGRNAEEAFAPAIVEKNGIKLAFLGFSKVVPHTDWKAGRSRPGVADTYALEAPLEAIAKAREVADLVIVLPHWGLERKDKPEKYQREFARSYIDAGADLVIGSHPHVLQGFENYKGKWIVYSLGNFIFTMNENPQTWETVILDAVCSKTGSCSLQAVPVLTKLANPKLMEEPEALKLFKRLTSISFDAEVLRDGKVQITAPK